MPKRTRVEAAIDKTEAAIALGGLGGQIAGPIGAGVGGLTGLIIGDAEIVFPVDMIAIPAFEFSGVRSGQHSPSVMIYIKEGEVLRQVQLTDAQEAERIVDDRPAGARESKPIVRRKSKSKYKKAYSKAFQSIKPDYLKANGQWKKGGFKRAVKKAHAMAKEAMK